MRCIGWDPFFGGKGQTLFCPTMGGELAAGTNMMGDMNDAAVFVVESVDEVPEDVLLRAALKGLTVMSRLSFQTMGTQGALLKFHAYLAMRKQWFISEGVRRKHPLWCQVVEAAFASVGCKSKLVQVDHCDDHLKKARARGAQRGAEHIWVIEKSERDAFQGLKNVFPKHKVSQQIRRFDEYRCVMGGAGI